MATRANFSDQEWEDLRRGVTGAALLVSVSDRSLFDSFKEAGAFAKHMGGGRHESSELVRDLSAERGTGFSIGTSPQELERETMDALHRARSVLDDKAPEELDDYRAFVLDVAESVANAASGGEQSEAEVVERIRSALEADPASRSR